VEKKNKTGHQTNCLTVSSFKEAIRPQLQDEYQPAKYLPSSI